MKTMKRILSAVLLLSMLLCLAACGGKGGSKDSDQTSPSAKPEQTSTQTPETAYTARHTPLSLDEAHQAFSPYSPTDDGFYMGYSVKTGENTPEGAVPEYEGQFDVYEPRLAFVSYDGKVTELEGYAPPVPEVSAEGKRDFRASSSVEQLFLNDEGNLVTLESMYCSWSDAPEDMKADDPEYAEHMCSDDAYYIRVLDSFGAEQSCARLQRDSETYLNTYSACLDNAGNVVMPTETGVQAYGTDGELAYELDLGGYVMSTARLKDGRVAALGWFGNGTSVNVIDGEKKAVDDSASIVSDYVYNLYPGGGAHDLYYTRGTALCALDLASGESETLFDWLGCDLNADKLSAIMAHDDGSFTGLSMDGEDTETFSISEVPYDSVPQKEHLTLATLYMDGSTQDAIIKFNRGSDKYRIDVQDYSQYNTPDDYSAGRTKLLTEIMAGNVPDILSVSSELPYRRLAAKGLLEDLTPYIEADKELKLADFFPNVIAALTVDGKLCAACSSFGVQTVAGAASVVGDTPGWTYDDYFEALKKMPEGCEGFDFGVDKSNMLMICTALDMAEFVDWSTGECRFDSEDFIKILNYAASFPDTPDENYQTSEADSPSARIAAGKQMLYMASFTGTDFMIDDYDEMFGGKATLIGFPTTDGSVGSVLGMNESYAMSSACKNKDAAWEFIRGFLTEEYQENIYSLPTNINAFEKQLERAMEVEYEQDANGNYILDENGEKIPVSRGMIYDGMTYKEIYATTPEQAQQLRDAIAAATKLIDLDQSVIDIVTEQAEAFFAGQKTAEETAKLIQSKANIYVNEQR